LELTGETIHSNVKEHSAEQESDQAVPKRSVIGIGGSREYTLYDPTSYHFECLSADKKPARQARGFGLNV